MIVNITPKLAKTFSYEIFNKVYRDLNMNTSYHICEALYSIRRNDIVVTLSNRRDVFAIEKFKR
jgi:hypothetical protein